MENLYPSIERFGLIIDPKTKEFIPIREKFPYNLFETKTAVFPFVKYYEQLSHINDYIYFISDFLNNKRNKYKNTEQADFYEEKDYIVIDDLEGNEEWLTWNYLTEEVNKCNNIVLLLSFLEGSLKEIFEWYMDELQYHHSKKEKGTNKIEYYINEISLCCNYPLEEKLKNEYKILEEAKKIRNIFIHEWDAYYNDKNKEFLDTNLKKFKIGNLINVVTKILEECENAGISCKILTPRFY